MSRMFGTDGVRGVAGTELTTLLAMQLARREPMCLRKKKRISLRLSWDVIRGFREECLRTR